MISRDISHNEERKVPCCETVRNHFSNFRPKGNTKGADLDILENKLDFFLLWETKFTQDAAGGARLIEFQ